MLSNDRTSVLLVHFFILIFVRLIVLKFIQGVLSMWGCNACIAKIVYFVEYGKICLAGGLWACRGSAGWVEL